MEMQEWEYSPALLKQEANLYLKLSKRNRVLNPVDYLRAIRKKSSSKNYWRVEQTAQGSG